MAETNFIPTDGRLLWVDTVASIPANWSRDTNFDDKFIQGSSTAGSTAGGGHTHTQSHTHTGNAHDHSTVAASATVTFTENKKLDFGGVNASHRTHSHQSKDSANRVITYQNNTTSLGSTDMQPPYTTAIILEPDDAVQDIPDGAVCFTDESSAPTGFTITDGQSVLGWGATADLVDDFILGADTGDDGAGTGGSATHANTIANHMHSINSHTHPSIIAGTALQISKIDPGIQDIVIPQHHFIDLISTALSDLSTDAVTVDNASSEPAYTKLLGIQNTSGGATTPLNVVVMFDGVSGDIPDNWTELDGSGGTTDLSASQIKVTATGGAVGDTGGSNTHPHTTQSHGHTHGTAHTHSEQFHGGQDTANIGDGGSPPIAIPSSTKSHGSNHNWTIGTRTPTLQNNTFTSSTDDGRYNYREVVFIKKISEAVAAVNVPFFGANF